MKNSKKLSIQRLTWIREQGYFNSSYQQIQTLAFGNRFSYRLSLAFLVPAVSLANLPLLIFMNVVAFLGILLPNHPFDYIYNYLIRRWTNRPKLPPRSPQFKFASTIASLVIVSTIYFITVDMMIAAYIIGGQLIIGAALAGFIDFCFLAKVYNFITGKIRHMQASMSA